MSPKPPALAFSDLLVDARKTVNATERRNFQIGRKEVFDPEPLARFVTVGRGFDLAQEAHGDV